MLGGDSLKIKGNFLRAMYRSRSLPCPAGKAKTMRPRRVTFSRSMITSHPWDCGYPSHRRPFGTAVTRPTEDLLGLRLLVPPKTFCDVIDTSTSCASKAQREPAESVRLAWRSRCPLQPQRFHLSLIHLNTKIALVSILF